MTPIITISAIAGYFILLFGISAATARKGGTAKSFFNGDRKMPWGIVAFASLGAAISGVTFISVPGMTVTKGYSYLQMALGFVAGYCVIAWVLIPLYYRRNLLSIYGFLNERFGRTVYKTGAGYFFVSKLLGASVRFFVVCAVLQPLVFTPIGIPFSANVIITVALIWLYTKQGGVRTIIYTDLIKSFCLVATVIISVTVIAKSMGWNISDTITAIRNHPTSRILYLDNPMEPTYFWKQFIAGIFLAIAMNGLDQDIMQRHLTCRNWHDSAKNMITGGVIQLVIIALFLALGTMLVIYATESGLNIPQNTDELFATVATSSGMPVLIGIIFVIGLISASYSAAASALTALTTSFTIDILGTDDADNEKLTKTRKTIHPLMALLMVVCIIIFHELSSNDAISAVYTLASYTYGPLLGLFAFGLLSNRRPPEKPVAAICILSPVLSLITAQLLQQNAGYSMGFELLLLNAFFTMAGMWISLLPQTLTNYGQRPA